MMNIKYINLLKKYDKNLLELYQKINIDTSIYSDKNYCIDLIFEEFNQIYKDKLIALELDKQYSNNKFKKNINQDYEYINKQILFIYFSQKEENKKINKNKYLTSYNNLRLKISPGNNNNCLLYSINSLFQINNIPLKNNFYNWRLSIIQYINNNKIYLINKYPNFITILDLNDEINYLYNNGFLSTTSITIISLIENVSFDIYINILENCFNLPLQINNSTIFLRGGLINNFSNHWNSLV